MFSSSPTTPQSASPDPHSGGKSPLGSSAHGGGSGRDELAAMQGHSGHRPDETGAPAAEQAARRPEVEPEAAPRPAAEADRLRRERHRHEAQRLESLGALAGGMAHQFNNLLTVITGHAGLAAADAPAGSNQAHSLEEVRLAAQRAAVLCRQMLDAAGHSVATRRPLRAEALCEEALAQTRGAAGGHCRIEYHPALLPLPQIRGVAVQLQQALKAVYQNAFEAVGAAAGVVRIALHDQLLDATQASALTTPLRPGRYVCVEVRDDGVGIPPEALGRVFEPFFSTKGLGRGLGLAAASGILRAHGGAIAVESHVGAGSMFRIYLPALEASAEGN